MNMTQVHRFVRKVSGGDEIAIGICPSSERFAAYVDRGKTIWLVKNTFFSYPELEQKVVLAHEIGHIKTPTVKGVSKREYAASRWAINRAYKLGMKRVARSHKKWLRWYEEGLQDHGYWQSYMRRYVLASRMAKKSGLI